jgi:hypothetical protein
MLLMILCLAAILFFRRYFPILGLKCKKWGEFDIKNINVIDVRDYNDSYKEPISGAINIPIAYLNRYYPKIPKANLYIVASDKVGINMGVRILRKKGFQIIGCTIKNNDSVISFKNNTFSNC